MNIMTTNIKFLFLCKSLLEKISPPYDLRKLKLIIFLNFPLPDGMLLKTGVMIQIPPVGPATQN